MKFYLEKRVLAGFIVALSILSWLGYYSYSNNKDFVETSQAITDTNEVLYHIEKSQSAASEIESLLLKYVISGDTSFMNAYTRELNEGAVHFEITRQLTADNSVQKVYLDSIVFVGSKKIAYNALVVKARQQSAAEAQKLIPSQRNGELQRGILKLLEKMQAEENRLLAIRIKKNNSDRDRFNIAFSTLLISTVIILMTVFFMINKNLKARLLAEEKTQQLNQELEAFTYSVSHDLRAPLRSVDGYAKVLYEDYGTKLDEEGHRTIQVIISNAKKMGYLIDDLLEFSRIGRKELIKSSFDMNSLTDAILKEQPGIERVMLSKDVLLNARGDLSMIRQVWVNLISNAVKYSQKTETPAIHISSFRKHDQIVYSIRDNGVGFDMQYSHKLFGVFQRLHKAKDFEGTGVGLALVHRIIQKHNGHVWAEAEINKGAAFYFSLPA